MKTGLLLAGVVALAGVAIIVVAKDEKHGPPEPPAPLPPAVPVVPAAPLVLPQFPAAAFLVLEPGALYTFMLSTGISSPQDLSAALALDGWHVVTMHEVIAQGTTRPPFDYVVDAASWQGDPGAELRIAQDMLAGKFTITTAPQKVRNS